MRSIFKKHFTVVLILPLLLAAGCADEGGSGSIGNGGAANAGVYIAVASGNNHTCGIDTSLSSGTLKCWGSNFYGQLGDGTQTDRLAPNFVDTANVYTQVSIGTDHTCAIAATNILRCWGRNNFGQLGIGSLIDSAVPVTVDAGTQYTFVSVAGNSSCAIALGGQLKCWGYNGFGSVGDNTTINRNVPTNIDVGTSYKFVSMGELSTCAITSADFLKCWGNNQYGQLGDGTLNNRFVPTAIDGVVTYQKISSSTISSFFTCGLTMAGKIKCWGQNLYGELGDGTTTSRLTPTAISIAKTYTSISVGYVHACAIEAVTGKLSCWGKNDYGQLGDYTTTTQTSEVVSDTPQVYLSLSLGYNYTCGRTNRNLLRCWGRNDYGQIGDGTLTDVLFPKGIQ